MVKVTYRCTTNHSTSASLGLHSHSTSASLGLHSHSTSASLGLHSCLLLCTSNWSSLTRVYLTLTICFL